MLFLAARLVVASAFAIAGVGKLFDSLGFRQGLADFGVPSRFVSPLAVGLPSVELAIAASLLPNSSARLGAAAAAALLLVFELAIAASLARGRRPECHCFGRLHSSPVGWSTIARNGFLLTLALGVAWGTDRYPFRWPSWVGKTDGWPIVVLLVLVGIALIETWFILNLSAQNGRILMRLEALEEASGKPLDLGKSTAPREYRGGLPVGSPAPRFQLPGVHSETLTLDALRAAGLPVMLVFTDPDCSACSELLPEVAQWQRQYAAEVTIAVITRGDLDVNRSVARELGLRTVLVQKVHEVAERYRSVGTPSAVVIDAGGNIGSPLRSGAEAIRGLLNIRSAGKAGPVFVSEGNGQRGRATPTFSAPTPDARLPQVGGPSPSFTLQDLDGHTVRSDDLRGHPTLLLFWSPGCGFCQRMLEDLRAWERDHPADAPRLLVVATGSEEANRALGLASPVVLDPSTATMRAFHANGTPTGVLIDAHGRVASLVAVGAEAVFELLRGLPSPAVQRTSGKTG